MNFDRSVLLLAAISAFVLLGVGVYSLLASEPVPGLPYVLGSVVLLLCLGWFFLRNGSTVSFGHQRLLNELNRLSSKDLGALETAPALPNDGSLTTALASARQARIDSLVDLRERGKELDALATAIRIFFCSSNLSLEQRLQTYASAMPAFWLHPEHGVVRISYAGKTYLSDGFEESPWRQEQTFACMDGSEGKLEYFYTCELPELDEGPFLKEERTLITNLAELIRGYIDSHIGHSNLESLVSSAEQLSVVVSACSSGDFTRRMTDGTTGIFAEISSSINQLVSVVDDSLQSVSSVLSEVAEGRLGRQVEGHYEGAFKQLKDSTNQCVSQLQSLIGSVRRSAEAVNTSSSQIAAGTVELSERTEQQAASLEETAASMEQMTATVQQNADNARQAARVVDDTRVKVDEGIDKVITLVETMSKTSESASRIESITDVIDGIAFQTNLLALNAAVEAARAGDQGRGFAVVAGEVRALAQRAADSAREIKSLIAVSVNDVGQSVALANKAKDMMSTISDSVSEVTGLMAEISSATDEQSQGIGQVSTAVSQLDEATQQNSALVEETSSAAAELSRQAESLKNAVDQFSLKEDTSLVPV